MAPIEIMAGVVVWTGISVVLGLVIGVALRRCQAAAEQQEAGAQAWPSHQDR